MDDQDQYPLPSYLEDDLQSGHGRGGGRGGTKNGRVILGQEAAKSKELRSGVALHFACNVCWLPA